MPRGKKRTMSVHWVSPRTSGYGTSSEPTSVQAAIARAMEAIGHKCAQHNQEHNDNIMSIAPEGTASNNSEPLTRGDIYGTAHIQVYNLCNFLTCVV